jgi:hypothetical protein
MCAMSLAGRMARIGVAAAVAIGAGQAGLLADPEPSPLPAQAADAAAATPAATPAPMSPATAPPAAASEPPAIELVEIEGRLLRSEGEAFQLCEAFMQRMVSGDYDEAFRQIRPYFPISEQKFAALRDETKKQHALAELQFGKALGFVYLDESSVKDVLLRYRFIERYEFEAIRWEFVFYQPERGWLLNRAGFDDDVDPLFQ